MADGRWLEKPLPPAPDPTQAAWGGRRSAAPRKAAAFRARLSSRRGGFEPVTDRGALGDYEARRLLNALVKEYVQMTAEDPDQGSEGSR